MRREWAKYAHSPGGRPHKTPELAKNSWPTRPTWPTRKKQAKIEGVQVCQKLLADLAHMAHIGRDGNVAGALRVPLPMGTPQPTPRKNGTRIRVDLADERGAYEVTPRRSVESAKIRVLFVFVAPADEQPWLCSSSQDGSAISPVPIPLELRVYRPFATII
jgi:hypothetical protein